MTSPLEVGSWLVPLFGVMFFSALPLAAAVWALVALARLQRGQTELLARLAAIERRLASKS